MDNNEKIFAAAYKSIYKDDCDPEIARVWTKVAEAYRTQQILKNFNDQPLQFSESSGKKAKEIALEAAVKMLVPLFATGRPIKCMEEKAEQGVLVELAEAIYQWLIKEDKNGNI